MQMTLDRQSDGRILFASGLFKMYFSEDDAMKMAQGLKSVALSESTKATIVTESPTRPAVLTLEKGKVTV